MVIEIKEEKNTVHRFNNGWDDDNVYTVHMYEEDIEINCKVNLIAVNYI